MITQTRKYTHQTESTNAILVRALDSHYTSPRWIDWPKATTGLWRQSVLPQPPIVNSEEMMRSSVCFYPSVVLICGIEEESGSETAHKASSVREDEIE
mmetsp:Transcript_13196/g.26802  ORF Transcript_13196/g.26802 Transcript_13196/m.26802 type:complete len:98 (-) Transcript_13196:266-559(-)